MRIKIDEFYFPDRNFREYLIREYGKEIETDTVERLNVSHRKITSLKGIEFFTNLRILDCSYNYLTELDSGGNFKLQELYCYHNNITKLDLRGSTCLKILDCSYNSLSKLDLRGNFCLEKVYCYNNNLIEIILKNKSKLQILFCYDNNFTELLLGNLNELTILKLDYILKDTLNISKCPNLTLENVSFEK